MQATAKMQEIVTTRNEQIHDASRGNLIWEGPIQRSVPKEVLTMLPVRDELDNGDPPDLMLWGEE
jgi:hypothetical protein